MFHPNVGPPHRVRIGPAENPQGALLSPHIGPEINPQAGPAVTMIGPQLHKDIAADITIGPKSKPLLNRK